MTLRQLLAKHEHSGNNLVVSHHDLGEARGKQELFARQSPALESAARTRARSKAQFRPTGSKGGGGQVAHRDARFGEPHLRDRNEEEVRGYREALDLIQGGPASITEPRIKQLRTSWVAAKSGMPALTGKRRGYHRKRPDGTSHPFQDLAGRENPGAMKTFSRALGREP